MSVITDVDLARLHVRSWKPAHGVYTAPAATALWDGTQLTCTATGAPLDAAAAIISPLLARALAPRGDSTAAMPVEPTVAAVEADYDAATAALRGETGQVVDAVRFAARLAACRACNLWAEAARQGKGRCQSVRCQCSKRLLWLAGEVCPELKWPA